MNNKSELRKKLISQRSNMSVEDRSRCDRNIFSNCMKKIVDFQPDAVLSYASYGGEADTTALFRKLKEMHIPVFYPVCHSDTCEMDFYLVKEYDQMTPGYKGILEPQIQENGLFHVDLFPRILVIIPGTVFDGLGNRIGYGKGYYDRFVSRMKKDKNESQCICFCGIGYSLQLMDSIPTEETDQKLSCFISEKGYIDFERN